MVLEIAVINIQWWEVAAGFSAALAAFVSPLLAVWASDYVGRRRIKEGYNQEKRRAILDDLIRYIGNTGNDGFLRALNSLRIYFNDKELRDSLDAFHTSLSKELPEDEILIDIILRVAKLEGFDLTREDINKTFSKKTN